MSNPSGRTAKPRPEPVWVRNFEDLAYEWRRVFAEAFGTFLLVLAGAGAVLLNARTNRSIGRVVAVSAPGLTVAAVILSMGAVSGAHLNPVVTLAFALRRDFRWARVPAYLGAQTVGGVLACLILRFSIGTAGHVGATVPGAGFNAWQATIMEGLLTLGLVTVVLGTASTAQNIGPLASLGVGSYIVLSGLWASPVSGASMNPGAIVEVRPRGWVRPRPMALLPRTDSGDSRGGRSGLRPARPRRRHIATSAAQGHLN